MDKIVILIATFTMIGCAAVGSPKNNNFDEHWGESVEHNIEAMKVPVDNANTKPAHTEINTESGTGDKTLESPLTE